MFLRGARGKADQVVDDDVDGATNGVSPQIGEIQRFRPDALAGKGRVAMHNDPERLFRTRRRAGQLRTVDMPCRDCLARARPIATGSTASRWLGLETRVNADLLAGGRGVYAGGPNVIFHVARAKHAARIDILEARDHVV